jgi:hypothetical protein
LSDHLLFNPTNIPAPVTWGTTRPTVLQSFLVALQLWSRVTRYNSDVTAILGIYCHMQILIVFTASYEPFNRSTELTPKMHFPNALTGIWTSGPWILKARVSPTELCHLPPPPNKTIIFMEQHSDGNPATRPACFFNATVILTLCIHFLGNFWAILRLYNYFFCLVGTFLVCSVAWYHLFI